MNTGVTTNKNSLGVIALVLAIGALWQVRELLRAKGQENRNRRLFAQSVLLAFCVTVLVEAHSATSGACFILATTLILATGLRKINRRPAMVHALVLTIVLGGALTMFFGGEAAVVHALGRQTNFTGRTEIWAAVIPAVPNKLVGSGFESFWLGPSREIVWRSLSGWANVRGLNEAHNGYIEVYLNLGWVGVMLLSAILFRGYVRAVAAFRRDPATGSLALTYLAVSLIYSVTEAGFRLLDPIWISLLLGIVAAGGVDSGVIGIAKEHPLVSVQSFSKIGTGYREHQYC